MKVEDIGLDLECFHTGKVSYETRNGQLLQESSVEHYASTLEGPYDVHLMALVDDGDIESQGVYLYFHEDEIELLKATLNFIKMYKGKS